MGFGVLKSVADCVPECEMNGTKINEFPWTKADETDWASKKDRKKFQGAAKFVCRKE